MFKKLLFFSFHFSDLFCMILGLQFLLWKRQFNNGYISKMVVFMCNVVESEYGIVVSAECERNLDRVL